MEELTKSLDKLNEALDVFAGDIVLYNKLMDKYNNNVGMVSSALQAKSIEDGIVRAFGNASLEQLENLKNSYRFIFYDKEYINDLIETAIKKRIRRDKIIAIEKKES